MENVKKLTEFLPENAAEYARKTFKIAVFGVKNNFVLAGILLIGYCVIAPAVFIAGTVDRNVSLESLRIIMGIYSIIAAYVGGILIPAVMFAYVQQRRDREFYHSMPVKRGQYFIGYLASGFVMFAAPYLLMCVIMGLLSGYIDVAFSFIFQSLALYVVIYANMTFSIMFSGSFLSSLVTLLFLNAFPAIVVYCSLQLNPILDYTAYYTLTNPYLYIFTPISGGYTLYDSFVNQGIFGWVLWVQLGVAVIELVLAYIMYKLRRGETTMAVAFPKTRYILQYGVMFLVAFFCTSVFSSLNIWLNDLRFHLTSTAVIMTAIMTFAAFVILNMILEQNFRAAFHKIRHLFIFVVAYVVLVAALIGIMGSIPRWVVPIRTDAILITQRKYISTYDDPTEKYPGYDFSNISVDENGRELYHIILNEEYFVITDPEQVEELTKRIYDYENDLDREYVDYYFSEGEYSLGSYSLYTLKPGKEITDGMYIDDLVNVYSQRFGGHLDYMPQEELDSFTSGMDIMRMHYKSYYTTAYAVEDNGDKYAATTAAAENEYYTETTTAVE